MWWLLWCPLALAGRHVAVDALPEPVKATLAHQWPDATAVKAEREGDGFEVELSTATGRFDATVRSDGTWVQTEEDLDPAALPPTVAAAATGRVVEAERVTSADGTVDYELVVRSRGARQVLHVDPQGVVTAEPQPAAQPEPWLDDDWDGNPGMDGGEPEIEDEDEGL